MTGHAGRGGQCGSASQEVRPNDPVPIRDSTAFLSNSSIPEIDLVGFGSLPFLTPADAQPLGCQAHHCGCDRWRVIYARQERRRLG